MWFAFTARRVAGLASVIGTILTALCAIIEASRPNRDSVAAIFPPWWKALRAFEVAAAAGDIAAVGRWRTVLILRGESQGLALRLRAAGALIVIASGSFIGCAQTVRGKRP